MDGNVMEKECKKGLRACGAEVLIATGCVAHLSGMFGVVRLGNTIGGSGVSISVHELGHWKVYIFGGS